MNPLMQEMGQPNGMDSLMRIARMLQNGDPEQIAKSLMQNNPQFRAFMQSVQGKTPEQFAQENGIDLGSLMGRLR